MLQIVSVITMSASTLSGSRRDPRCHGVRGLSIASEGLCFGWGDISSDSAPPALDDFVCTFEGNDLSVCRSNLSILIVDVRARVRSFNVETDS